MFETRNDDCNYLMFENENVGGKQSRDIRGRICSACTIEPGISRYCTHKEKQSSSESVPLFE